METNKYFKHKSSIWHILFGSFVLRGFGMCSGSSMYGPCMGPSIKNVQWLQFTLNKRFRILHGRHGHLRTRSHSSFSWFLMIFPCPTKQPQPLSATPRISSVVWSSLLASGQQAVCVYKGGKFCRLSSSPWRRDPHESCSPNGDWNKQKKHVLRCIMCSTTQTKQKKHPGFSYSESFPSKKTTTPDCSIWEMSDCATWCLIHTLWVTI